MDQQWQVSVVASTASQQRRQQLASCVVTSAWHRLGLTSCLTSLSQCLYVCVHVLHLTVAVYCICTGLHEACNAADMTSATFLGMSSMQ